MLKTSSDIPKPNVPEGSNVSELYSATTLRSGVVVVMVMNPLTALFNGMPSNPRISLQSSKNATLGRSTVTVDTVCSYFPFSRVQGQPTGGLPGKNDKPSAYCPLE